MRTQALRLLGRSRLRRGFSLIEIVIAIAVISMASLATISLLTFCRMHNDLEMERSRAYQIVSEEIELNRFTLYPRIRAGERQTIWNNGTPNDTTDDTVGDMTVTVRDAFTGVQLTDTTGDGVVDPPNPAVLVSVEVMMEWIPRGRIGGLHADGTGTARVYREVAMTYIAPN